MQSAFRSCTTWRSLPARSLLSALLLPAACDGGGGRSGTEYVPDVTTERLASVELDGDDIGLVQDFDMDGDTIYLLDRTGRVLIITRSGEGVRLAGGFGRSGGGPGEFMMPTGIALAGDGLAVIDGTRLHFFTRAGGVLASRSVVLPCPMMLPGIAASRTGLFVHGGCMRGAYVTDTVKAVLAWSSDTTQWSVITETPRYTQDGSFGSIFGATRLLSAGARNRHAFGGGEINCIWLIDDAAAAPTATETCPAAAALYTADPPPAVAARLRRGTPGMKLRWPGTLPVYMDRFVTEDGVLLLRPFSTDSIVLQTAAPRPVDIAVAPLNGLIGCKSAGCLWVLEEDVVPRVIVLERADIERRIRAGAQ